MLKRKRPDSYGKQQAPLSSGQESVVERGSADLNLYSASQNRKEETFEVKEGLRITVGRELELQGRKQESSGSWCGLFFPSSGFTIILLESPVKGFPSIQACTTHSESVAFLQQLRAWRWTFLSHSPWVWSHFPSTDHFNMFKAEQWTLHRSRDTERPQ